MATTVMVFNTEKDNRLEFLYRNYGFIYDDCQEIRRMVSDMESGVAGSISGLEVNVEEVWKCVMKQAESVKWLIKRVKENEKQLEQYDFEIVNIAQDLIQLKEESEGVGIDCEKPTLRVYETYSRFLKRSIVQLEKRVDELENNVAVELRRIDNEVKRNNEYVVNLINIRKRSEERLEKILDVHRENNRLTRKNTYTISFLLYVIVGLLISIFYWMLG